MSFVINLIDITHFLSTLYVISNYYGLDIRLHLYEINLNVRYNISCQKKLLTRMMSLNAVDKTLSPDMTYTKTLSLCQLFMTD